MSNTKKVMWLLIHNFSSTKDIIKLGKNTDVKTGGPKPHEQKKKKRQAPPLIFISLLCCKRVDLLQTGDGIAKLPFHQMYVIDLSMSQEAIINHLLEAIMKIERPEFEGQRKSAANDLIQTQEDINKEEVINLIIYFTKLLLSSYLSFAHHVWSPE